MEFNQLINKRRSLREYKSTPVEQIKIDRIMEAVQIAPTACNYQPFRFLIIKSEGMRERVESVLAVGRSGKRKGKKHWVLQAPLLIFGIGNKKTAWKRYNGESSHIIDVSIAMQHLILAATNEGLGTCWICAFDQEAMHQALKLEPEWEVVAFTPLGYSDQKPEVIKHKLIEDLVSVL